MVVHGALVVLAAAATQVQGPATVAQAPPILAAGEAQVG